MKNNLKKIKQSLFLLTTLLILSCSKDNFEDDSLTPENSQNKRTIKEYNFNEANKQPKFFIGYSKIKKGISKFSTNSSSKVVPRDVNFTIDTTTIKEITNGNIRTYTMLISRPEFTNSYFENLVIKVDEQDSIKAYIVTYFPERNIQYHQEHDSYIFNGTSSIREIEYDPAFFNLGVVAPFECHTVYYCSYGGQEHLAGDNCNNTYGRLECSSGGGGNGSGSGSGGEGGGSGGGGGSGSSGNGSSGSGTSGTTTTTPVITDTAPVVPFRNINLVTILSLDPTQATWINSATNAAVKRALQEYMYYNPTNVSFGVDVINYLISNANLSFSDVLNNKTNFDLNNSIDNGSYVIGGFDTNTYANFNPQQIWANIPSVIPVSQFVGWGATGIARNCMDYAKAQIAKKGYQISAYNTSGQTFQIYTSQNGVNTAQLSLGLNYLKYALSNGIPVIVGVDDAAGHPGNLDNTTDHFIVIVGMGHNSNGNYFQFYDNASGQASQGASTLNLLYYNSTTGLISGSSQTSYGQNQPYPYILTMIRKSKTL